MAVTEAGFVNLIANFKTIITNCTALGATYNPSKAELQLAALNQLHTDAEQALNDANQRKSAATLAVDIRAKAVKEFKLLVTRVVNLFEISDALDSTKSDARNLLRDIQGRAKQSNDDDKSYSKSRLGYDTLPDHLNKLIAIISNEPSYTPNESELQVSNLITVYNMLKANNENADLAQATANKARSTRDDILSNNDYCVKNTAKAIKKYIKAVAKDTPEGKTIMKIKI